MDGGARQATVHGVANSQTRLSNFTFTFHFHALEKEMATQSRVLAWRIPGTAEAGGLAVRMWGRLLQEFRGQVGAPRGSSRGRELALSSGTKR